MPEATAGVSENVVSTMFLNYLLCNEQVRSTHLLRSCSATRMNDRNIQNILFSALEST